MSESAQVSRDYGNTPPRFSRGGIIRKRWDRLYRAKQLIGDTRLAACHSAVIGVTDSVSIWRDVHDHGHTWFGGVMRCGDVWRCALCAERIGFGRRLELEAAATAAGRAGYGMAFVTATIQHHHGDQLADLVPRLCKARARLSSWRAFKILKKKYGVVGSIRTLEVTHGVHGWHPHYHEIVFTARHLSDVDLAAWKAELGALWIRATVVTGLSAPDVAHGIRIQAGYAAASYISKWGIADEMVGAQRKEAEPGSVHGLTPWDLLDRSVSRDWQGGRCGQWWIEYARVFRGRRQLVWSRGLRALLAAAPAQSDLDLAEADPEHRDMMMIVDSWSWRAICRLHAHWYVLALLAEPDFNLIAKVLSHMRKCCVLPGGVTMQDRWLARRDVDRYALEHGYANQNAI